jgi:hypothetical protein
MMFVLFVISVSQHKLNAPVSSFNLCCDTLITKTLINIVWKMLKLNLTPIIERPEPPEPTPGTTSKALTLTELSSSLSLSL